MTEIRTDKVSKIIDRNATKRACINKISSTPKLHNIPYQAYFMSCEYTHAEQWREINAGNDVKMGSGTPEYTAMKLAGGELERKALDESVQRVLQLILHLV